MLQKDDTRNIMLDSGFCQSCKSGNSAISLKDRGLTDVKIYAERSYFLMVKINYKVTKDQMSVVYQV